MSEWYVTRPGSKKEVKETRTVSKEDAQNKFVVIQTMLTGDRKPWAWWEKNGYRVRRG